MFTVDSDIPPPAARAKYPLATMNVGDSFALPAPQGWDTPDVNRASKSVYRMNAKQDGKRFTAKLAGGEWRVWRTA